MSEIVELFGASTHTTDPKFWRRAVKTQRCPFLDRTCIKVRKSRPDISIGTCMVGQGRAREPIVICPFRFLERRQVFTDSLHLLTLHEPGNELHVIPEVAVPGGSVDYFLVSVRAGRPVDFVGIELQTLDTTGTVWPARQRFLRSVGLTVERQDVNSNKSFGMNWKMTAKTILVQLHHKVETFEHVSKRLVLVVQDRLMDYMQREFDFAHINTPPRLGDAMQFHAYAFHPTEQTMNLRLAERHSTDAQGVSAALGLKAHAKVELSVILDEIRRKLSERTLWTPA